MVYTLRIFSSKRSLFHNSNVFGSCIIHILYTGCAKIKKNSGAKRLTYGRLAVPFKRMLLVIKMGKSVGTKRALCRVKRTAERLREINIQSQK